MFFVPFRKLSKLISVRCVSSIQESRQRHSRGWLFLTTAVLICLYVVIYHKSPQKMFLEQRVLVNNANMIHNKEYLDKKNSPNIDLENGLMYNIRKHIEGQIKESNKTPILSANMVILRITQGVVLEESHEKDETMLYTVGDSDLPVRGSTVQQNESKERNVKRRLTDNLFREVKMGGYYYPIKKRSRHKVAILIPYRNRKNNLDVFMFHMHPFLIQQQLEYRIFVIEQAGDEQFNRGKLLNIGFTEMMKYNDWQCVVLQDVDFLPLSDKILYTCPIFPRHMLGQVIEKANLTYNQYHILFGGVTALSVPHFMQINGFSNLYWGWGGEDNDMYWRILSARLPMIRYHESFARYKSLPHVEQPRNNYRYQLLKFAVARYKTDGLSSLVYKVIWTKYRQLYTHILADVNPLRENITELYSKMFC